MKKVLFILTACLLIAACNSKPETVDIEEITFENLSVDTLRVNVIIWKVDTLTGVVSSD